MPTGPTTGARERTAAEWPRRRGLAAAVRIVSVLAPALVAWVATWAIGRHLLRPAGRVGAAVWLAQVMVVGASVVALTRRLTRRLVPLAVLCDLALVFPDRAPSRVRVALRAGTTRKLGERLDRLGPDVDPAEAVETLLELVGALGRHERLTRGHTERVRAIADVIGEELELGPTDRHRLQWACLLHDIGKLAVPAEILAKPGKPDDDEWAILKRHPAVGGEIVAALAPWLGEWGRAAAEHHERWDGTGYPRRLAGTDISLAGRIVAVADAYDVITCTRSYKKPMSAEAARAELVRCAGTQFDPDVVRALLHASLGRMHAAAGAIGWLSQLRALGALVDSAPVAVANLAFAGVVTAVAFAGMPVSPDGSTATDAAASVRAASVAAPTDEGVTTTSHALLGAPKVAGRGAKSGASPSAPAASVGSTTTTVGAPTTSVRGDTATRPPGATPGPGAAPSTAPTSTAVATGSSTTAPSPTTSTTAPQSTPVANDDSRVVLLSSTTVIDVLADDTDADGDLDPSSLAIVRGPAFGSARVQDGAIVYSVGLSLGSTTVVYRVCDLGGRCAQATLGLTVVSL